MLKGNKSKLKRRNNGKMPGNGMAQYAPDLHLQNYVEDTLTQSEQTGGERELIHPGDDSHDLNMRSILPNWDMPICISAARRWCHVHEVEAEFEPYIKDMLSLLTSVYGRARKEFIMSRAGVVSEAYVNDGILRRKRSFSIFGRGSDENEQQEAEE